MPRTLHNHAVAVSVIEVCKAHCLKTDGSRACKGPESSDSASPLHVRGLEGEGSVHYNYSYELPIECTAIKGRSRKLSGGQTSLKRTISSTK